MKRSLERRGSPRERRGRDARSNRVLVLEDDYLIAEELQRTLRRAGVDVIGPVATKAEALASIEQGPIDFALLDIILNGEMSFDLAETLETRGVPFAFATGFDVKGIPERFSDVPLLMKPFRSDRVTEIFAPAPAAERPEADLALASLSNRLLMMMSEATLSRLRPHMSVVELKRHLVLTRAHEPIDRVYFPTSGVCSLLFGPMKKPVEIAVTGKEGAIGACVANGQERSPYHTFIQIPGEAIAVAVGPLMAALADDPEALRRIRLFRDALTIQIATSAAANATQSIEQRLARWLLMCADRAGDELNVVHEHISLMLSVRRAGVTGSMHALEAQQAIKSRRGVVTITDRDQLRRIAGWTYIEAANAYREFLG